MIAGDIALLIARYECGCDAEPKPWQVRAAEAIELALDDEKREREDREEPS